MTKLRKEGRSEGGREGRFDYPPVILRKSREYSEVRRVLKENGASFQTLLPARLQVEHKEESRTYDTMKEASWTWTKEATKIP